MFARILGPASLAAALAVATPTAARADFLFSWDYTNAGATVRRGDTPRGPQMTSGIPGQTPGVGGGSSLDSLVFTGSDLGFGRQGLLPGQGGQRGGARTGAAFSLEAFGDDAAMPKYVRFRSGNRLASIAVLPRAVPEPGVMLLFGLGLIFVSRRLLRRRPS
jgi:hypothetical protein